MSEIADVGDISKALLFHYFMEKDIYRKRGETNAA